MLTYRGMTSAAWIRRFTLLFRFQLSWQKLSCLLSPWRKIICCCCNQISFPFHNEWMEYYHHHYKRLLRIDRSIESIFIHCEFIELHYIFYVICIYDWLELNSIELKVTVNISIEWMPLRRRKWIYFSYNEKKSSLLSCNRTSPHISCIKELEREGKSMENSADKTTSHHINRMNAYQISNAGNAMNNKFSSTTLTHIMWIVVCSVIKLTDRLCEFMQQMRTWRKELLIPLLYQYRLLIYFYGRGLTIIIKID